jgi:hemolysin D
MPLELVRDWVQEFHPSVLLRSPSEREFLPAALEIIDRPASPTGRLVAMTICVAALLALGWATFGKIDVIATASGQVIAIGNTKTIQPLEIGKVRAIRAADGDVVRKGQVLLELDPTEVAADTTRYSEELRRAELDLAKQQGLWTAIKDRQRPIFVASVPDASAPEIAAAQAAMRSEYDNQAATLADLDEQNSEKTAEIAGAANSIEKYRASLPFVQQQADLRADLMKLQFSNKLAYLQAQQNLVEQQRQIVVLGSQKDQAVAEKQALIQKRKEAVSTYEKNVLDDLTKVEAQVAELRAGQIKSAQQLEAKTLRSPIDGVVQQLSVHTVGGIVTPAQALMLVVPRNGGVVVEAHVSNRDIGFVHAGQKAEIKVDTFNFTRYGLIDGIVTSISRDAVAPDEKPVDKENKRGNSQPDKSEPSYIAYIRLDRNWIDTESGRSALGPGMIVTAEIHTGRRRIIDYLLSPLQESVAESLHER